MPGESEKSRVVVGGGGVFFGYIFFHNVAGLLLSSPLPTQLRLFNHYLHLSQSFFFSSVLPRHLRPPPRSHRLHSHYPFHSQNCLNSFSHHSLFILTLYKIIRN